MQREILHDLILGIGPPAAYPQAGRLRAEVSHRSCLKEGQKETKLISIFPWLNQLPYSRCVLYSDSIPQHTARLN